MYKNPLNFLCTLISVALTLTLAGCGGGGSSGVSVGGGTADVTVGVAGTSVARTAALPQVVGFGGRMGPVDEADIESLTVTLTSIVLDRVGSLPPSDGVTEIEVNTDSFDPFAVFIDTGDTVRWTWNVNGLHTVTSGFSGSLGAGSDFDGSRDTIGDTFEVVFLSEGVFPYFSNTMDDIEAGMAGVIIVEDGTVEAVDDDDNTSKIEVFSGSQDIDLVNLDSVSEILSSVQIPAGTYTKIRLSIENPRLVLAANPGVEITNVQLTANGRVFVSQTFDIPANTNNLILLDFMGIHLVETGSGKYVLTPQLRTELTITSAEASVEGEVLMVDETEGEIELLLDSSTITILVTEATVIVDADDLPITLADITPGDLLEVDGILNVDGTITALTIQVLPPAV